jgi:hypothetical protein
MKLRTLIIAALLNTSCGHQGNVHVHAAEHRDRVARINAEYDRLESNLTTEASAQFREVEAACEKYSVELDAEGKPVKSLSETYAPHFEKCGEDQACRSEVNRTLVNLFVRRYYYADLSWVQAHVNDSPTLEAVFAASHNRGVRKKTDPIRADIQHAKENGLAQLAKLRVQELQLSKDEMRLDIREDELEEQQRVRRALAGLGAGLQAAGQSLSSPSTTNSYQHTSYQNRADGCSSDFDCGLGNQCLKVNYSSRGRCIQTVDSRGSQTYETPRTESVNVKTPSKSDCRADRPCPIGFVCDNSTGACLQ